eukprot:1765451-Pleurochrysis_carterae.AAC.1
MNRVEVDYAGRDLYALTWHVEPTAVPRDRLPTLRRPLLYRPLRLSPKLAPPSAMRRTSPPT